MPAVPQSLDRHADVRPGRSALRWRRRRRQLQQRRLRSVRRDLCRRPGESVRRSALAGRHAAEPPDGRGRRTAQPERAACRRPGDARRCDHPDQPGHRAGPAGQPVCLILGPERPPHRRLRAAQPVPVHAAAGHRRAMDRRCRLEHLGGDRPADFPDRHRYPQLRLAVLRGAWPAGRIPKRRLEPVLQPLCHPRIGGSAVLHVQAQRLRGELPGLSQGRVVHYRPCLLPGRVVPGRLQRGTLLRRSHAKRDLGHDAWR